MTARAMRIAGPILLVATPVGVILGVREAYRLAGARMALLMVVMIGIVGALVWWTVHRIRREAAAERAQDDGNDGSAGRG
jgi:uncharacterized membrane protein YqjE